MTWSEPSHRSPATAPASYPTQTTDGLVGSICARAEALVLRLAMLYALVDGDNIIRPAHLRAGLALWDYAARSIAWATRDLLADPVAEQIHAALATSPTGLTRTQLRDLFGRNLPGAASTPPSPPSAPRQGPTPPRHHHRAARRDLDQHRPPTSPQPLSRGQGRPTRAVPQGPKRSGGP